MLFSEGTRLGPYQITAPTGAGGMGEVYKAHDTRLDRTVHGLRRDWQTRPVRRFREHQTKN